MIFSFRAASLSFAILFTTALGFSQSSDLIDLEFGTLSNFDIATWNVEFFPKNGETTIEYMVEIIEELEMDVIALQEIDNAADFEALLSSLQGYDGFYQENDFLKLGFIYNNQSVTVTDQYQLFESENFGNPFPRRPLVMELTFMDEHTFVVINNHFKCCGNGTLDSGDFWDEESRRAYASELLKGHIEDFLPNENVILLGDLNDLLTDDPANNVFQTFLDFPESYRFVDMDIATGPSSQWSFPNWPSHLDHILITDALFSTLADEDTQIATIQIDDYFPGGFSGYENQVSDHLPVGFGFDPASIAPVSVGSNAFQSDGFRVYPNPTKGIFKVEITADFNLEHLELFDSVGRKIRNIRLASSSKSVTLDSHAMTAGIYSLILTSRNGEVSARKLIVVR